jgi:intracellular sulfur oxidation DsrE/DsrF family protein
MKRLRVGTRFVICIRSGEREDLEPRKVYHADEAAEDGLVRVIDESGEDYLYTRDLFVPIELPRSAEEVLLSVA